MPSQPLVTLAERLWDARQLQARPISPPGEARRVAAALPSITNFRVRVPLSQGVGDVKAIHEGRWFALMLVVPAVVVGAGIYLALPFFTDLDTDYELLSLVIGVGAISALPIAQKWISVSAPRRDPGYRVRAQAWGIGIAGLVAIVLGLVLVGVGIYAAYHCHASDCSAPWWALAAIDGSSGLLIVVIGGYMVRFARRWYGEASAVRADAPAD